MDRRPLVTSRIWQRKERKRGLVTTLPMVVTSALRAAGTLYLSWPGSGRYRAFILSRERVAGSSKITLPSNKKAGIPPEMAEDMGLGPGGRLDWMLAAIPGNGFQIHVRRHNGHRPAALPGGGPGVMPAQYLLSTRVGRFEDGRTYHVQVAIPKPCLRLLGAEEATHVRWTRNDHHCRMIPCGPSDEGARRITLARNGRGNTSNVAYIPRELEGFLYRGTDSAVDWHAAADGMGRWEVRVTPSKYKRPGRL